MNLHQKSVSELLESADDLLVNAQSGLNDVLRGSGDRRVPGLWNLMVFGRAFLMLLAQLRRRHPGFDDWYEQNWRGMMQDPQMRDFEQLRSELLKESRPGGNITGLKVRSAGKAYGAPPRFARAFFTGDRLGGTGWEVVLPDGTVQKYYVLLSSKVCPESFRFRSEGVPNGSAAIEDLSTRYMEHLTAMMQTAREYFG